jgi:phospholipid-binding lipoprotein MlaA
MLLCFAAAACGEAAPESRADISILRGGAEPAPDADYFAEDNAYDDLALEENGESKGYSDEQDLIADPLESWNRFWFTFNDYTLEYVASPLAQAYEFIVPAVARESIGNFFHNLRAPARIINCLLQGKGLEAGVEFSSFIFNTVAGIGGLFDPASSLRPVVQPTGEDFGQTLGRWGLGEGFYLVLPLLGPGNLRDTFGLLGDFGINMLMDASIYNTIDSWEAELGISAVRSINGLGDSIRTYKAAKELSIADPYASIRNAYTKIRRSMVEQ